MLSLLVLFVLQSALPQAIVGRWDAEARSKGGLGEWLVLAADGTFTRNSGAMIDGRWTLEGNSLTVEFPLSPTETDAGTFQIELKGNTLQRTSHGVTQTLKRVNGHSGTAGLIGSWISDHPSGRKAYEQFLPEGRYLFRVALRVESGRYAIEGSTMTMTPARGAPATLDWTIEASALILRSPGNSGNPPLRFRREAPLDDRQ